MIISFTLQNIKRLFWLTQVIQYQCGTTEVIIVCITVYADDCLQANRCRRKNAVMRIFESQALFR